MAWLLVATAAQFINAIVAILDKYIVTDERGVPRPFVYAFYSCLITGGWIVVYGLGLIPGVAALNVPSLANVQSPSIEVVGMSFLAAYTLFMALVSMYNALKRSDASTVFPIIGAVSALASFGMGYLFLATRLEGNFTIGIVLLAIGTLLVAQTLPKITVGFLSVHAGIFFALHYIAMKGLFLETSFDDGFFWSRIAFILFALSLLLVPTYWDMIFSNTKSASRRTGMLVLGTKILAGIAAFMLLKATDWGDVAVVQATDGMKFVFILVFAILCGKLLPESAGENEGRPQQIVRKALYVMIIVIGYFLLFV